MKTLLDVIKLQKFFYKLDSLFESWQSFDAREIKAMKLESLDDLIKIIYIDSDTVTIEVEKHQEYFSYEINFKKRLQEYEKNISSKIVVSDQSYFDFMLQRRIKRIFNAGIR